MLIILVGIGLPYGIQTKYFVKKTNKRLAVAVPVSYPGVVPRVVVAAGKLVDEVELGALEGAVEALVLQELLQWQRGVAHDARTTLLELVV